MYEPQQNAESVCKGILDLGGSVKRQLGDGGLVCCVRRYTSPGR